MYLNSFEANGMIWKRNITQDVVQEDKVVVLEMKQEKAAEARSVSREGGNLLSHTVRCRLTYQAT